MKETTKQPATVQARGGSNVSWGTLSGDSTDDALIATDFADPRMKRSDLENYAEQLKARIRRNSPRKEDLETCLSLCEGAIEERHMEAKRNELAVKRSAPAISYGIGDSEATFAKRASISKAILAAAQGKQLDGAEAELDREGRNQHPHASANSGC